ncbi:MAG TPA: crosslink repair DNA glycosylase YcaQ family protein [Solirubrobacteraceae bacterium]|nr:crosslink repair DNA glycosylase YcaQ family protein [Solirubrobacteraceae bacterium]
MARGPADGTSGIAPPACPLLARRLTAQLLAGRPARSAEAVCARLLAVQAQDPRAARLAVRARTRGLSAADVDRALTQERSLLVTWVNRGTLHLLRREDYPLLQALTTPALRTANTTRLRQTGVSEAALERGLAAVRAALAQDGPLTRSPLVERLRAARVPVDGQAFVHIMFRAALDGLIVRGPMQGAHQAYVLLADWMPEMPAALTALDRDAALADLARRHLIAHAPAEDRDLARWAGISLGAARAGLRAIADELHERADGRLELRGQRRRPAPLPPPRLLGPFEELLLGWDSRELVLGPVAGRVISGGVLRGFALVQGRAVAGWRFEGREVRLDPYAPLAPAVRDALHADGAAAAAFLGL